MKLHASGEDYLEAVLILEKKKGAARSVDIAEQLGVSKPSVSRAVSLLKEGGFLWADDNLLYLTDAGREVAEKIYERHCFFKNRLLNAGVDETTAERKPVSWNMAFRMTALTKSNVPQRTVTIEISPAFLSV